MFNRKKEIQDNIYDRKRKEYKLEYMESGSRLRQTVENVFVKNEVINLYPEGPDKEQAKKDAEKAKHTLLCAIGEYDCIQNEYKNYYLKNIDNFQTTVNWDMPLFANTSHYIIESAYKYMLK